MSAQPLERCLKEDHELTPSWSAPGVRAPFCMDCAAMCTDHALCVECQGTGLDDEEDPCGLCRATGAVPA